MNRAPIFLSAGVPDKDPHKYSVEPIAVREAVRALVGAMLPARPLVFGGHPAISPMVWEDADSLGLARDVFIYQSRLFATKVPKEAHFFQGLDRLVWTPAVPLDRPGRDASLALMRDAMIVRRVLDESKVLDPSAPPDFPEYSAGVFIGGMQGIEDEWRLFRASYPNAPALLVASTGGAARLLIDDAGSAQIYPPAARRLLERDRRYRFVFRSLLPP
ncbi:SLOG domain-containing protein [Paludisphaera soli]|uniref:SLOG domain-containing protein n=1 Tax=Paludisphaera soli TaxID=2712865 RepID=UPI0013EBDEB2|nr:hypothetical protein [Paludisphaera soli]